MLSLIFAVLFGVSLLPGRKPLCLRFAERVSGGIMPDGAERYCRRLTWLWFAFLSLLSAANIVCFWIASGEARWGWCIRTVPAVWAAVLVPAGILAERYIVRPRRFRAVFRTSGSTGGSKTVVKTFESLAKEVAYHRARLSAEIPEFAARKGVVFLSTVEPQHMYGTLWRVMLPKAAGCEADPEVIMSPEGDERRRKCMEITHALQKGFREQGFDIGEAEACVTPIHIDGGGIAQATKIAKDLRENYKIFCSMVIYPVIPKGMIIFRIVSTAAHTMEDVEYTLNAFKEIKAKLDAGLYDGDDIASMKID